MAVVLGVALNVLNLGYGFEGSFTRLQDFRFVSESLATAGDGESEQADHFGQNRFADSWLGAIPLPVPKNYVMGIDVQWRDFEPGYRESYLRDKFGDHGWWYYYLYALAIKVPLGTWLLIFLAAWIRFRRRDGSAGWRDEMIVILPAAVVLVLVSSQTGFNQHMRYVLPIFPFVFIWASQIARAIEWKHWKTAVLAGVALAWSVGSSPCPYPDFGVVAVRCKRLFCFELQRHEVVIAAWVAWVDQRDDDELRRTCRSRAGGRAEGHRGREAT